MLRYRLSCSRESYCHTIHIHDMARSSIPIETSRISLRQIRSKRLACAQSLHSIEDSGSRICMDLAFHSPMRVRRGFCQSENTCAALTYYAGLISLFENLASAIRARRRRLENAIRHARIGLGNTVEDVIKRDLSTFRIAAFTRFNQPLGFAQSVSFDKYNLLLFGCWVEEVRHEVQCSIVIAAQSPG